MDRYWRRLSEGGDEKAQQCGWLKDRFEAMPRRRQLDLEVLRRAES